MLHVILLGRIRECKKRFLTFSFKSCVNAKDPIGWKWKMIPFIYSTRKVPYSLMLAYILVRRSGSRQNTNTLTCVCLYIVNRSANDSIGYELGEPDLKLHPPTVGTNVSGIRVLDFLFLCSYRNCYSQVWSLALPRIFDIQRQGSIRPLNLGLSYCYWKSEYGLVYQNENKILYTNKNITTKLHSLCAPKYKVDPNYF